MGMLNVSSIPFEETAITLMGVGLIVLSHLLGRKGVFRFPAAVALAFSGVLAIIWQLPRVVEVPENLSLPFEVAELQFFAALSISLTLFALDIFIGQARSLASASEMVARQTAEIDRAAAIEQLAAIVESSNDAIVGSDLEGNITSWNPAAERLYGYASKEALGRNVTMLFPPDRQDETRDMLRQVAAGSSIQNLESVHLGRQGTLIDVSLSLSSIRDANGETTGISTIARDITEAKRAEELRKLALLDELTGLNNRRGFMLLAGHQSSVARRDHKPMTLLFIDLNNLKTINDNFGHKEGDRAIIDAANVLKETFRESDILARVGGDEFCVLMTGENELDIETPLTRLHTNVELHNAHGIRPYKLSLSVGRASYDPKNPQSIEELMRQADLGMYQDKMTRANRARLLVGDDDVATRSEAEKCFGDAFEVITAQNGEEVIRRATLERPDVILLDYTMPDLVGTEIARRLRQAPATTAIPIVMMGIPGDGSTELDSLRAGANDYVRKPFDEETLRVRMENLIRRAVRR